MNRRGFLAAASAAVVGGFAATLTTSATASSGTLRTNVPMRSEILGTDVPYTVYLPGSDWSPDALPIVYLLHGGTSDNNTSWAQFGNIKTTMDDLISNRRISPTVVVTPDGRRDTTSSAIEQNATYYMNDADGEFRWEDMFIEEMIPHVEAEYGAGGSPLQRGISGYSMGGYGAFMFAMLHPGTFAGVAGLSTSHRTDEQITEMDVDQYNRLFGSAWGFDLEGEDRLNDLCRHYDLADMIRRTPREELSETGYYLDTGSEDEATLTSNDELRAAFDEQLITHEFHSQSGGHDWDFWRPAVVRGLEFLNSQFERNDTGIFT